jgi:hypothetical protein
MAKRKIIGYVGVDSGQLMVCDPCYLLDWKANEADDDCEGKELSEFTGIPTKNRYPFTYSGACMATLSKEGAGKIDWNEHTDNSAAGIAVRTMHGDGRYPVIANINDKGQITSITIKLG